MATTMKGLLKGLRYISQIFDEEKEREMQIGFPTDVKHVAHIGSDGPATNTPSWMIGFKSQEHENGQVVSRVDSSNHGSKYNPEGTNQRSGGVGLKGLLPSLSNNEKPKQKTRRKQTVSPPRRSNGNASADEQTKESRHHRSTHGSMDSSNDHDASVHRRRSSLVPENEVAYPVSDGSTPPRKATSRPRKLKSSAGGDASMKKSKGKPENSVVQ